MAIWLVRIFLPLFQFFTAYRSPRNWWNSKNQDFLQESSRPPKMRRFCAARDHAKTWDCFIFCTGAKNKNKSYTNFTSDYRSKEDLSGSGALKTKLENTSCKNRQGETHRKGLEFP